MIFQVNITAGVMDFTDSLYEGLYHLPKLYGSEVRPQGKVKDWKTGLKEAQKVRNLVNPF